MESKLPGGDRPRQDCHSLVHVQACVWDGIGGMCLCAHMNLGMGPLKWEHLSFLIGLQK